MNLGQLGIGQVDAGHGIVRAAKAHRWIGKRRADDHAARRRGLRLRTRSPCVPCHYPLAT